MKAIVAFATAWGFRNGGINAFNIQLLQSLAKVTDTPIACLVPTTSSTNTKQITDPSGVNIIEVPVESDSDWVGSDKAWRVAAQSLNDHGIRDVDWWLGHDVTTGMLALALARELRTGQSALIMHMSYRDYQHFKKDSPEESRSQELTQQSVVQQADLVLAVGPLLARRASELAGSTVTTLLPGHVEHPSRHRAHQFVNAITTGRLDAANNRIKQTALTVAAYAQALAQAGSPGGPQSLALKGSRLTVVGVPADESDTLRTLCDNTAGAVTACDCLPYSDDRSELLDLVAGANLALMPSWHEGFGLVGWEAMCLGTPLICSIDSGLYQFLKQERLENRCIPIEIKAARGQVPYTNDDQNSLCAKILNFARDMDDHLKRAGELQNIFATDRKYSWQHSAETFRDALIQHSRAAVSVPEKPPSESSKAENTGVGVGESAEHITGDIVPVDCRDAIRSLATDEQLQAVVLRDFLSEMLDIGINLRHPRRARMLLPDLYVMPDLQIVTPADSTKSPTVVRSDRVADRLLSTACSIVLGDYGSGKTALAKILFLLSVVRKRRPVLLTWSGPPLLGKELTRELEKQYRSQHQPSQPFWENIPKHERVIILDGFHRLSGKAKYRKKFVDELRQHSSTVILFANSTEVAIEDILGTTEHDLDIPRLHIKPLGHLRRNELVESWCLLDADDQTDRAIAWRVKQIETALNNTIGRNLVPAVPSHVLAIIQAVELGTPVDTNAGTQGHLYEVLIRSAIANGLSADDYDLAMAYLAMLATRMMDSEDRTIQESQLPEIDSDFCKSILVDHDGKAARTRYIEMKVLQSRDGRLRFRYSYLLYFFCAYALRGALQNSDPEAQDRVRLHASRVDREESSNVLLFLAHLSCDGFVMNTVLQLGRSAFNTTDRIELIVGDFAGIDTKLLERETQEAIDVRVEESKRKALDDHDIREDEEDKSLDLDAVRDQLAPLKQALAVLQILGQLLKNFPGRIAADRKKEITRTCLDLARRTIGWINEQVDHHERETLKEHALKINRTHPSLSATQLLSRAQRLVAWLAALAVFGMVRRVSWALGSSKLLPVIRAEMDKRVPIEQLFEFSINLELMEQFPISELDQIASELKSNPMAFVVLRTIVQDHCYLYPVQVRDRQAAYKYLDMKYSPRDLPLGSAKLLPPK